MENRPKPHEYCAAEESKREEKPDKDSDDARWKSKREREAARQTSAPAQMLIIEDVPEIRLRVQNRDRKQAAAAD